MASRGWSTWWLHLIMTVVGVSTWWQPANSDPQINLVGDECSSVSPINATEFVNNRNTSFSDLRRQLSEDRRFATSTTLPTSSDPVYAMVQCRNYMSVPDCLACFDTAVLNIVLNCSPDNGARVTYDGCFLRCEVFDFYTKSSENAWTCGDISVGASLAFREEVAAFIRDLQLAIPKTKNYFAASKMKIKNAENLTIYGMAQCVETITPDACRGCVTSAYETIRVCLYATEGRVTDAGCFMRFSIAPFFNDSQITDIKPPNSDKNKAAIGGVAGGACLAVIIVAVTLWFIFSRKLRIATRGNILGATELQRPNRYSYRELEAATNNFSEENCVGRGAFGFVYKAMLANGIILAVKKLNISYSRAKADYEAEVRLISNVHHRNLLRLLGCCTKASELLLIYEYMENGSLDKFLYGEKRGLLTWKQRLDIIFGTARGIAYLHEHYHVTIIHRDIKPSNILLDSQFLPKIADFGLVKLLPENQTHISTGFAGTLGYTAPEYARNGHLSEKVDVYSFGIVVLEIISGRRCNDINETTDAPYLLEETWKLYESGEHHKLADESLESGEYEVNDLKKMTEIALVCTQPVSSRPTMSEVVVLISGERSAVEQVASQRPPPFGFTGEYGSISNGSHTSNATVSVSHYTGR
ncbi:hypothetical protein ACS0TY_008786 [Phlomoides rotata]